MDPTRFDRIATLVAQHRLTRRHALGRVGSGGLAAGLLRLAASTAAAQGTPASAAAAGMAADNATLFVQTATGGSFRPNPRSGAPAAESTRGNTSGTHLVTLTGHNGETIAFSDRPARNFGEVQTSQFFKSMGFTPANPPNAALVADVAGQPDAVVLVELLHPVYDAGTRTLTYDANLLHQYPNPRGSALAPLATKAQATPPATFGTASLFIDDCPNLNNCIFGNSESNVVGPLPGGPIGQCWNWGCFCCQVCDSNQGGDWQATQCHNAYPNSCSPAGSDSPPGQCQAG